MSTLCRYLDLQGTSTNTFLELFVLKELYSIITTNASPEALKPNEVS